MEFKFLLIIILVKDILLEQIKDYKIGLSLPFKDNFWESYYNNFMNNSIKFLNEGIHFNIIVRFSKKSMSIQQADIEYLLSQKINVLIIVPQDTKASKNIIKYCEIIDIPIISFNRLIYNAEILKDELNLKSFHERHLTLKVVNNLIHEHRKNKIYIILTKYNL